MTGKTQVQSHTRQASRARILQLPEGPSPEPSLKPALEEGGRGGLNLLSGPAQQVPKAGKLLFPSFWALGRAEPPTGGSCGCHQGGLFPGNAEAWPSPAPILTGLPDWQHPSQLGEVLVQLQIIKTVHPGALLGSIWPHMSPPPPASAALEAPFQPTGRRWQTEARTEMGQELLE